MRTLISVTADDADFMRAFVLLLRNEGYLVVEPEIADIAVTDVRGGIRINGGTRHGAYRNRTSIFLPGRPNTRVTLANVLRAAPPVTEWGGTAVSPTSLLFAMNGVPLSHLTDADLLAMLDEAWDWVVVDEAGFLLGPRAGSLRLALAQVATHARAGDKVQAVSRLSSPGIMVSEDQMIRIAAAARRRRR